ncbi:MAG: hypothetical protein AB1744_11385 [Candidatus Zixiibacteriota bacterium]
MAPYLIGPAGLKGMASATAVENAKLLAAAKMASAQWTAAAVTGLGAATLEMAKQQQKVVARQAGEKAAR